MTFHDIFHDKTQVSTFTGGFIRYAANTILVLITGKYILTKSLKYHKWLSIFVNVHYFCDLTTYTWYTTKLEIYNLDNFLWECLQWMACVDQSTTLRVFFLHIHIRQHDLHWASPLEGYSTAIRSLSYPSDNETFTIEIVQGSMTPEHLC